MCLRKKLLKVIKLEPNFTYNIHDTKGLKLLKRLRLGLSRLGDHKFRLNFQDCVSPMCTCSQGIETTTLLLLRLPQSSLCKENPLSQDKPSK